MKPPELLLRNVNWKFGKLYGRISVVLVIAFELHAFEVPFQELAERERERLGK